MRYVLFSPPFYEWRNWGTEGSGNLHMITQFQTWIQAWVCLPWSLICSAGRELGNHLVQLVLWFLNSSHRLSYSPTTGQDNLYLLCGRGSPWVTKKRTCDEKSDDPRLTFSWSLSIDHWQNLPFGRTKENQSTSHGSLFVKRESCTCLFPVSQPLFRETPLSLLCVCSNLSSYLLNVVTKMEWQNSSGSDQLGDRGTSPSLDLHAFI